MPEFQPTPEVSLFFPCEDAVVNVDSETRDLKYGWWEIRRPLYHVWMQPGVSKWFGVPELPLYYQISGGRGKYSVIAELLLLDLAEPSNSGAWLRTDPVTLSLPDQLAVSEEVIVMKHVVFPEPGMYQFNLKWRREGQEDVLLPGGTCYLRVFSGVAE